MLILKSEHLSIWRLALACGLLTACGSNSEPSGQGGSATGGASGSSNSAGGKAGSLEQGGTSGAVSGGAGAGGGGGVAGSAAGGAPTLADAMAAIHTACESALMQCPQLDEAKCESNSASSLPAPSAPCFTQRILIVQCIGKLPPAAFQCIGDQASASQTLCPAQNDALQACYADAGA